MFIYKNISDQTLNVATAGKVEPGKTIESRIPLMHSWLERVEEKPAINPKKDS